MSDRPTLVGIQKPDSSAFRSRIITELVKNPTVFEMPSNINKKAYKI